MPARCSDPHEVDVDEGAQTPRLRTMVGVAASGLWAREIYSGRGP
jgi:hypothetical protein